MGTELEKSQARRDGQRQGRQPLTTIEAALPAAHKSDEILTREELAVRLKVAMRTIQNWQRDGFLPFLRISNAVLFHWPTVLAHLRANFSVSPRGHLRPQP